jgi:hypothetical protein
MRIDVNALRPADENEGLFLFASQNRPYQAASFGRGVPPAMR